MYDGSVIRSLAQAVLVGMLVVAALSGDDTKPEAKLDPPAAPGPQKASGRAKPSRQLSDISLEELMNIEVSSVGRKDQKLNQAAAAVFVVTQEDIRRSGATSVPEALRMVPGLQVAQIDGSKWAISARGFAGRFSNKMLVLIDGRSVYNMLYSGVYWEQDDVMMEDIDRIEVIRGPGATMWGANAVNGVINIITKSSRETQGNLVSTSAGNIDRPSVSARHGGRVGDRLTYRTYTRYFNRADMATPEGSNAYDGWNTLRGGARVDFEINSRDSFTAQGDVFRATTRQSIYNTFPLVGIAPPVRGETTHSGGFGLARWRRVISSRSDMAVQAYYDSRSFTELFGGADLHTADLDFQHRIAFSRRHEVVWGGGYRFSYSRVRPQSGQVTFDPTRRNDHLSSAFVQDNIGLIPERLILTVGSRFQHNSYTGFEVQPSLRLIYLATPHQSLWAAASRAVRTPSRADRGLRVEYALPGAPAGTIGLLAGDNTVGSEGVLSYEAGYRYQPFKRFSFDLAAFYSRYDHLKDLRIGTPYFETSPVRRLVVPTLFAHTRKGRSQGAEIATTFSPASRWRWTANYSWIGIRFASSPLMTANSNFERSAPRHQVQLRSALDLTRKVSFDTSLYYVSALQGLGVPAYTRLDTRLAWRLSEQFELSVLGQNLLDNRHPEFRPEDYVVASQIRRAFLIRLLWLF